MKKRANGQGGEEAAIGVEARIGHRFRRPELLAAALTHRSAVSDHPAAAPEDNERLEFLGDAVLGLAAARWLADRRPGAREGELSRLRAALVGESGLAAAAREIDLGPALRLGRGEDQTGGRAKPSILAGALEALLGAVFLDAGWRTAYRVARSLLAAVAAEGLEAAGRGDAKTRLQELCQRRWREAPTYAVVGRSGPAHRPRFTAEVRRDGVALGRGEGDTRKQAEQAAAAVALAELEGADGAGGRS